MPPDLSRNVTDVGDIHIVSLGGELDMATVEGLSEWLVDISGSTVVIDLSELTFMDSSGIGAMVRVKNELGDSLLLTRPQQNVRRVLELTGLSGWLTEWNPAWSSDSPDPSTGGAASNSGPIPD